MRSLRGAIVPRMVVTVLVPIVVVMSILFSIRSSLSFDRTMNGAVSRKSSVNSSSSSLESLEERLQATDDDDLIDTGGGGFPDEWKLEVLHTFDYVDKHIDEVATPQAIDTAYAKLRHGFLVRIEDGKMYINADKQLHAGYWKKELESSKHAPNLLCPILEMLCNTHCTKNIDFIYNHADEPLGTYEDSPFPAFSWVKMNLNNDLLVPYPTPYEAYPRTKPEHCDFREQVESEWDTKKDMAVWRGSTTGTQTFTVDNWREQWRPQFVTYCNANPDVCDAKLSGYPQTTPEAMNEMIQELGGANHMGMQQQFGYKYVVMLDGNSAPSSRMVSYLQSRSLILKQESPFIEFFYPSLRPYFHYLPISRSIEDVGSIVDWARQQPAEVKDMVSSARQFACEYLNKDTVETYIEYVFNMYASRFEGVRSSMSTADMTLISMENGGRGLCPGFTVDSCPLLAGESPQG